MKELMDTITLSEEGHEIVIFEQPHSKLGNIYIIHTLDPYGNLISEVRTTDLFYIMNVMKEVFKEYENWEEAERISFAIDEIKGVYDKLGKSTTSFWRISTHLY